MILITKAIKKFRKKTKILMAMVNITYAACGYVNVLSFSLTGWGIAGVFFCVCFKNSYYLNNNTCSLNIQSSHLGFPVSKGEGNFFVLRILALPFQIIRC